MKNQWLITFRVVDRAKLKAKKKSVVLNLRLEVPTELIEPTLQLIGNKVLELDPSLEKKMRREL